MNALNQAIDVYKSLCESLATADPVTRHNKLNHARSVVAVEVHRALHGADVVIPYCEPICLLPVKILNNFMTMLDYYRATHADRSAEGDAKRAALLDYISERRA